MHPVPSWITGIIKGRDQGNVIVVINDCEARYMLIKFFLVLENFPLVLNG